MSTSVNHPTHLSHIENIIISYFIQLDQEENDGLNNVIHRILTVLIGLYYIITILSYTNNIILYMLIYHACYRYSLKY